MAQYKQPGRPVRPDARPARRARVHVSRVVATSSTILRAAAGR